MVKDIKVSIGVDVDAVAGWLGSYGGQDSPCDISRGVFAGEVGVPRLLKLFEKYELKTTWMVPGHSAETFPAQIRDVVDAGHEIGAHGYSHENPIAMTGQQEEDVLKRQIEVLTDLVGRPPRGYVAPWWELSPHTAELLLEHGFLYDHSQHHNDFTPYYTRVKESWTSIDFSQPAASWMKPMDRGEPVDLVQIPGNWYMDDLPPMLFIKASPNSHGFVSPRDMEQMWRDQFDWVYQEMDYAVWPLLVHPDVSGRPAVLLALERLINHVSEHEHVEWMTLEEIAVDFRERMPFEQAEIR